MTVTVYSKPSCVACTATYRALDNKGINYNKIDVTEDDSALAFTRELGYMAAPVIVVQDEGGNVVDHWSQFRGDKLAELA
jgi:glutaredoxin-like protein NrdH